MSDVVLRGVGIAYESEVVVSGLDLTIRWYLAHEDWWRDVTSGAYQAWIDKNYGFRIAV